MKNKNGKEYFVLLVSVISVSTAAIWIKLASDVPSPTIALYRMVIGSLIIIPVYFSKELRKPNKQELKMTILSALFLACDFSFWTLSLKYTSVASSIVLVSTGPLYIILFYFLFMNKKPTFKEITSAVIAIIGIVAIASSDISLEIRGKMLFGDILAMLAAASIAGYLMAGQKVRKTMNTVSYIAILYPATAFFLIFPVIFTKSPIIGFSNKSYLYLLALGAIPQVIGHTGFSYALKRVRAFIVSMSILFEPVLSIIWAVIFLSEVLTIRQVMGGTMVLFSLYLSLRR